MCLISVRTPDNSGMLSAINGQLCELNKNVKNGFMDIHEDLGKINENFSILTGRIPVEYCIARELAKKTSREAQDLQFIYGDRIEEWPEEPYKRYEELLDKGQKYMELSQEILDKHREKIINEYMAGEK